VRSSTETSLEAEMAASSKIRKKQVKRRNELFPGAEKRIFDVNSKQVKGYVRMPRIVPLVAMLADQQKDESPGKLYQVLWSRDWGDGFIEVTDLKQFTYEAALGGTRARRNWRERIGILKWLGLIETAPRPAGEEHAYILLIDPYKAVMKLRDAPPGGFTFPQTWWAVFEEVCNRFSIDLESYRTASLLAAGAISSADE